MKKPLTIILITWGFAATAQPFAQVGIGGAITSGNMAFSQTMDIGWVFPTNPDYGGWMAAGTLANDFGHGVSYGGFVGYMGYQLSLYGGISNFKSFVKNGQKERAYPLFGATFRWEDSPAILDLRLQHNSAILTFGVGMPFRNHR